MLQVCICTHNPRGEIFDQVLQAIAKQTCGPDAFELLIVDNASEPPLSEAHCRAILGDAVSMRLVSEPQLGNAHARATAAAATFLPWLLFVDDDNELEPAYIQHGLDIIEKDPELGCFGGRLVLPSYLSPPQWLEPLLGYLAVKDGGEEPITRKVDTWGVWYPPTAGAFVRRPLLDRYLEIMAENPLASQLGRKGQKRLTSGEDSLIMLSAYPLGYAASYQPDLILYHHLSKGRFRFGYIIRLMYGYGRSRILLAIVLGENLKRKNMLVGWRKSIPKMVAEFKEHQKSSLRYALCMLALHLGYLAEARRLPL